MAVMPLGELRFCRTCLATELSVSGQLCRACGGNLLPFLDADGAISREYLVARGSCCNNGCRNCPYKKTESMGHQNRAGTKQKVCPRCAATFECRSGGCWCTDLRLSAAKLEWLKQQYDNCLCPACLGMIESSEDLPRQP